MQKELKESAQKPHCMRKFFLVFNLLLILAISYAQEVEIIKNSSEYLWGEGTDRSLKRADRLALHDLISQISTTVESEFKYMFSNKDNEEFSEYFEGLMSTYSTVTLHNAERKVKEIEGQTYVLRYIKKANIEELFANRKNKIIDYYLSAKEAEKELRTGDALKYYYWSLVLLRSHPDCNKISLKDEKEHAHLLITDIPTRITRLFSLIRVKVVADEKKENERLITLETTYKNAPVLNLDFTYWQGDTWSPVSSAKDGIGAVGFYGSMTGVDNIRLRIEYMYENKSNIDPELMKVVEVSDLPYFKEAELNLKIEQEKSLKKKEHNLFAVEEVKVYTDKIEHVCDYINGQSLNDIKEHFTADGYKVYEKLIEYGRAKVLPVKQELKAAQYGSHTYVRAVPMLFRFENNQQTFVEKVVFEFDSTQKVSNIVFAISDKALEDIQSKSDRFASEEEKALLINFVENYKTAYCLGRIDYLEQVFAEDALIIVGKVLEKKKDSGPRFYGNLQNDQVAYIQLSKTEYIDRLRRVFNANEFVNIQFEDNTIKKARADAKIYGIQIKQNYYSANYGDVGYLFLMIDLDTIEKPQIYVRTWQPQKNPDGSIYGIADFDIQ